jgi:subtilisin family serine protease
MAGAWVFMVGVALAGAPPQRAVGGDVVRTATASLIPGRALLKLRADALAATDATRGRQLSALGARTQTILTLRKTSVRDWLVVDVQEPFAPPPDEARTRALIARLGADPAVMAVSENRWARPLVTPNDPLVSSMWHLQVSRFFQAWDDERGDADQRIGVIDSGLIRTHEDIGSKAVVGYDFIADVVAANDGDGRDPEFYDDGERCGAAAHTFHGTHVAGLLAASTDNGIGVAGANWLARLAVVRALDPCGGDFVDIMEGASWLAGGEVAGVPPIGDDRVRVMNLSLGAIGPCTAFEQDIVTAIDQAGVVLVVAAGNDGGALHSPANCDGVLTVAAHDRSFARTTYTSFGPQVDIVAAGGDISQLAANGVLSTVGPQDGLYGFFQGTSMAAPQVAGVVSLMQAKDPTVTRLRAEQALAQGGRACTGCEGKPALDAAAALALIERPATDPNDDDGGNDGNDGNDGNGTLDDDLEDNDTAATAHRVVCGQTYALHAQAHDADWFVVDVDVGPLAIEVDAGAVNVDLFVLRDGTEVLLQSEGATGLERVSATVTQPRTLQILVQVGTDDAQTASGPYSLAVTCTGSSAAPPPVDPDEDPLTPTDPEPTPDDATDDDDDQGAVGDVAGPTGAPDLQAVGGCTSLTHAPAHLVALALLLRRRRRPESERG